MSDRKFVKHTIAKETGPYMVISGQFEAERYPGCPLADTNVELDIKQFCIHWDQKEEFMDQLAELISRFQI